MYVIESSVKTDPLKRWQLPDRIFFACGACQVLAYAAVQTYGAADFKPFWIRPFPSYRGNHIFVSDGEIAFDYHGWSNQQRLLDHAERKARRWWPGWAFDLLPISSETLISEEKSKAMGLHLREPSQFLFDALPRARDFLDARPPPPHVASRLVGKEPLSE